MQSLIVSMVRFSAAVTLYGVEQFQSTLSASRGGRDLMRTVDRMGDALDSLADVLASGLGPEKQETLRSVSAAARDAVARSNDPFTSADPGELFRAAGQLVRRSAEAFSEWMGKEEATETAEPQAAAAVLSLPDGHQAAGLS